MFARFVLASLFLVPALAHAEVATIGKRSVSDPGGPIQRTTPTALNNTLYQMRLSPASLDVAGVVPGTQIHSIEFYKAEGGATSAPGKLEIWGKSTTEASYPVSSMVTWSSVKAGATALFASTNFSIADGATWVTFGPFTTPLVTTENAVELGFFTDFTGINTGATYTWDTYPTTLQARIGAVTPAVTDATNLVSNSFANDGLPVSRLTFTAPTGPRIRVKSGFFPLMRDTPYDNSPAMAQQTEVPITFLLENTGTATGSIDAITLTPAPTGNQITLALDTAVPFDIAPGASIPVVYRQTPTATGFGSYTFSFTSDDALNVTQARPFTVYISGTAAAVPKEETDVKLELPSGEVLPVPYTPTATFDLGEIGYNEPTEFKIHVGNVGSTGLRMFGGLGPSVEIMTASGFTGTMTNVPADGEIIPPQTDHTVGMTVTGTATGPMSGSFRVYTYETGESATYANFTGTVVVTAPNIYLQLPSGIVPHGGQGSFLNSPKFYRGRAVTAKAYLANGGNSALHVVHVGTPNETDCITDVASSPTTVGINEIHDVDVEITPAEIGPFSFELEVQSDDPDTPVYTITVNGVAGDPDPEIQLSSGVLTEIPNGHTFVKMTPNFAHDFTITNLGLFDTLHGTVTIYSTTCIATLNFAQFEIIPGQDNFGRITPDPACVGTPWDIDVIITSDDPDEGVRTFELVYIPIPREIYVNRTGDITNGGTDEAPHDAVALSYAVGNAGETPLTISGEPTISEEVNVGVTVGSPISGVLQPGESGVFALTLAVTAQDWSFRVTIPNDDQDEAPFSFVVEQGEPPSIAVTPPETTPSEALNVRLENCLINGIHPSNVTSTANYYMDVEEIPAVPITIGCTVINPAATPAEVTVEVTEEEGATLEVSVENEAPLAKDESTTVTATLTPPVAVTSHIEFEAKFAVNGMEATVAGTWRPEKKRGLCNAGGDGGSAYLLIALALMCATVRRRRSARRV